MGDDFADLAAADVAMGGNGGTVVPEPPAPAPEAPTVEAPASEPVAAAAPVAPAVAANSPAPAEPAAPAAEPAAAAAPAAPQKDFFAQLKETFKREYGEIGAKIPEFFENTFGGMFKSAQGMQDMCKSLQKGMEGGVQVADGTHVQAPTAGRAQTQEIGRIA